MKSLIALIVILNSALAFAGSNDLRCRDAKGDVEINMWTVTVKSQKIEASYFADSYARLLPTDIPSFLADQGPRVIINSTSKVESVTKRLPKDECGNPGSETDTSEYIEITDLKGNVLKKTVIRCVLRQYSGHCA